MIVSRRILALALALLMLAGSIPAAAQIQQIAIKTIGAGCGSCAAVTEIYLRRLPGVGNVFISKSKEAVLVTYKPGAPFKPAELRAVLKKTEVKVAQMQISARGRLLKEAEKSFLVAGPYRFLLTPSANSPAVPALTNVVVEGIIKDEAIPMELEVLAVKPVTR